MSEDEFLVWVDEIIYEELSLALETDGWAYYPEEYGLDEL
jgi:hypothetical protein